MLSHASNDCDFPGLSGRHQSLIHGLDDWVTLNRRQHRHEQHGSHFMSASPDFSFSSVFATVPIHGCTDGDPRTLEIPLNKFFIGTAFQPERTGLINQLPPIVLAFLQAVASAWQMPAATDARCYAAEHRHEKR